MLSDTIIGHCFHQRLLGNFERQEAGGGDPGKRLKVIHEGRGDRREKTEEPTWDGSQVDRVNMPGGKGEKVTSSSQNHHGGQCHFMVPHQTWRGLGAPVPSASAPLWRGVSRFPVWKITHKEYNHSRMIFKNPLWKPSQELTLDHTEGNGDTIQPLRR